MSLHTLFTILLLTVTPALQRGMGFARSLCNTKAKLVIKGERYVCVKEKENTTISKSKNRER